MKSVAKDLKSASRKDKNKKGGDPAKILGKIHEPNNLSDLIEFSEYSD